MSHLWRQIAGFDLIGRFQSYCTTHPQKLGYGLHAPDYFQVQAYIQEGVLS